MGQGDRWNEGVKGKIDFEFGMLNFGLGWMGERWEGVRGPPSLRASPTQAALWRV